MRWLRDKTGILILLLVLYSIQAFMFWVTYRSWTDFGYLSLLEGVVTGIYLLQNWFRLNQKHKQLEALSLQPEFEDISIQGTWADEDWKKLVKISEQRRKEEQNAYVKKLEKKDDLYAMWVHQNKLPIAACKLILADENPNIRELKSQLLRMEQYTQMVLAFSKVESLETDYKLELFDLDDIIRENIHYFAAEFIYRKIQLNAAECHYQVLSDRKWISFVISQIVSNALKYTHSAVSIYMEEDTLIIEDDGPGISLEDQERIFQRGTTGTNGRNHQESTGLGLFLADSILKDLNHSLKIESLPGMGTTVKINLFRAPASRYD